MADDDDWGITPDYKNVMTEKEQRFGSKAVPGRVGHIDMDKLRKSVLEDDEASKKNSLPSASYGYGGKFGVEKDRMDKSAVGTDYHSKLNIHSSQQDYAKGFGGKYGIEKDRQDKAAVGYDHREDLSKHASQRDYSLGFGGKYGVQKDRVDASSVGYKDTDEAPILHQSQQRAEVTGGENRASDLRARFEKLSLDMNKPSERPARPAVGKLKPTAFIQSKSAEEPKLEPRPANVKPAVEQWQPKSDESKGEAGKPAPKPGSLQSPQSEVLKTEVFEQPKPEPVPSSPPQEDQTTSGNVLVSAVEVLKPKDETPKQSSITAVAIYDFQASHDDELSFAEGERIVDITKFDDAWWSGRLGDRVGIFPANRVQETTEGVAMDSNAVLAPQLSSNITAMALYDFEASQSDELSFKAGDEIVHIVKFDTDWWSGRVGDRTGIFPANRVSEN